MRNAKKELRLRVYFYAQQRHFDLVTVTRGDEYVYEDVCVIASVMLTDDIRKLDEAIATALNTFRAAGVNVIDETSKRY